MGSFKIIQQKLEAFIRKFYLNQLIRGSILFFATGLLYFLITLLVEYFLWLDTTGRTLLFWSFILVEALLFFRFIAYPLARLFNLQSGISQEEASRLIGDHFPDVSDKLLNVIQLNQNQRESELLAASIDQKSADLKPIPFKSAIDLRKNLAYLKYAAIPITIFLLINLLGDSSIFTSSYQRVVNYNTAYEPPAPFRFIVQNDSLSVLENKPFTLRVRTDGQLVPENCIVAFNGQQYYMEQKAPGLFEYVFTQLDQDTEFRLNSNEVSSRPYRLEVTPTPTMLGFEMELDYPSHTGKQDETINSSGNATIPEGTKVKWKISTRNTTEVSLIGEDTVIGFDKQQSEFQLEQQLFRKLDYEISTSNERLQNFESLSYSLRVIKDAYPEINLKAKKDSIEKQTTYYLGEVSDDYGLKKLQLVYYPTGEPEAAEVEPIAVSKGTVDQFVYTFPGNLLLPEGVAYEYYFEVFDNDLLHGYKSAKSSVFTFRKLTEDELENQQLDNQEETIEDLNKTLEDLKKQDQTLKELSRIQKEKNELNWSDKKKLEQFIQRQKQQEEMMKNFSKEMRENLENFQPEEKENDPFKEQLKERLENNERQLEQNEKLLEELDKLKDKIEREDLGEKLDQLAKKNKNREKSLEQLVELTKRYYVSKKAEKLSEELFELGEEQEKLADSPEDENTREAQEKLNKEFDELQKQMDELQKENQELKQPMEVPRDKQGEEEVQKEQQEASQNLEQQNKQDAKKNQKKAGQKMKQMGKQMQMSMMGGQMQAMEEDIDMLRQILDNLLVYSFEQEDLMQTFKRIDYGSATFGKELNVQNDLKLNFQHIDDSLFALSLRQPMISEVINSSVTEVQYHIDKSMERLAENMMRQGISSQQYAVTGANALAALLSDLLGNMQGQMASGSASGAGQGQGQGEGQGRGFQLPDIIKKQESLGEKMKEGLGKQEGEGQQGNQGQSGGEGGGEGQQDGENGNSGDGQGENGQDGKGQDGRGEGDTGNEEMDGLLYEIYKEQQQLRKQLEDRLSKEGLKGNGDLLRKMEGIEQQLLDRGFDRRTLEQMLNLKYELMKLEDADFEQGQENRRESETNRKKFTNQLRMSPDEIKKYFNSIEILNREALPLRQSYKEKVKKYFKEIND